MKKVTINYILWYFSRFNKEFYIEYNKLFDIVYFYNEELREVLKVLEYAEEHITIEQINNLYFEEFFSYTYLGSRTKAFSLTDFLDYAVKNLPTFRDDIASEL